MLKKLSILGTVVLLSACQSTQSTGSPVTESPRLSSNSVENSVYMKDTRPRGLGSRDWGQWNDDMPENAWAFNLTNIVPARNGELSQRFELRNGDCTVRRIPGSNHPHDWGCNYDRERAEVMHTQWRPGREKWIGFSVRVDDDWTEAERGHCTSIFQIKQTESKVYQGKVTPKHGKFAQSQEEVERFGGHYVGGPQVMSGVICGNKFGVQVKYTGFKDSKYNGWSRDRTSFYGTINNIKNQWNDVVMRWDTSDYRNDKSILELYLNGKRVGQWENVTSKFFPDLYTFKYGPYRGYMKANNGPNFKIGTQVIYYDEVRTGRSFDAVNPATNRALD